MVTGDSDTGKSYLLRLVDYVLGAEELKKVIDEAAGYETAWVEFANNDGEMLTLERHLTGGYVLNQKYKSKARVAGGAFSFCVGECDVAVFGRFDGNQLVSARDAFHMWLQTETHMIDFMAPIYREAFSGHPTAAELPRKMMQRPLEDEAKSVRSI
ncbi:MULTISPECIES: DUF2026 family protein [unclassified Rhizobium]|uniref:DUF2026 family protein n=1 Tax=unclassified Rhizobium TaxID=2613769 RepID=UPI00064774E2|nr:MULTISPECIES: DUF2026 family protein [unclassified Rhizobium]OJY66547.1 MAG: hypothetical protein BGP09_32040 [Rhizobium sp. 60-20]RKD68863.1 uncharacterized protein DUF2026 [Rhizobium sp. WW_1]